MYESLGTAYRSNTSQPHVGSHVQLTSLLDTPGINVLRDGHYVSRTSDFIVYSVEAESIHDVVAEYGPCELSGCVKIASDLDRHQLPRSGLSLEPRPPLRHQSAKRSRNIYQTMYISFLAIHCMARLCRRRASRWYDDRSQSLGEE